jgi:hypothetical protein
MNTYKIQIAEQYGTDLSNRYRAAQLRGEIASASSSEVLFEIDLARVRTISDSFADELFAVLVVEQGEEWFKQRVRVTNVTDEVRRTILSAIYERISAARA